MTLPVVTRTILCVALFMAMEPAAASAAPLRLQFITQVPEGKTPVVRLLADEPIDTVVVDLLRSADGKRVAVSTGPLARGARRDITLPADPGKHHYEGKLIVTQKGASVNVPVSVDAVVAVTLRVDIDRTKVDRERRRLEARLSRPPARVDVAVFEPGSDKPFATDQQQPAAQNANAPFSVTWPDGGGKEVARIDLTFHDDAGFFTSVSLFPWMVYIPHEEVNFATDQSAIAASETPKLEQSFRQIADALAKHGNIGPVKLFVAGHTDTVGAAPYNLKLSQRRAQSISAWFRKRGVRLPIFFEGFGEHAPLVGTPDETSESKNRRVDYILSVEEPQLKTTGFQAAWKRVP